MAMLTLIIRFGATLLTCIFGSLHGGWSQSSVLGVAMISTHRNEDSMDRPIDKIGIGAYLADRKVRQRMNSADGIEIASPRMRSCSRLS